MGSIIHNLFHVIDCEQLWVNQMQGTPVIIKDIQEVTTLDDVKTFSNLTRPVTQNFIESYTSQAKDKVLEIRRNNGSIHLLSYDKVLHHIFIHEIHHIGQLSVWAREIGVKPISSDIIFREL
ncbi:Uncharacterized damage-inducible protein DinB (forms a four-helix bundle) [Bacillus sp. OK048]|nr:Uncharacterized damage-inducible protein DinB (forms a four-helix bundle) [Bacillus sp. OK048]